MTLLLLGFVVLFALLFAGVPIGFSMGLVGVAGFGLIVGWQPALAMVGQVATDAALNHAFSVIPLFILMGNFISHSRIAEQLYDAAYAFFGHRRGGLAMATIVGSGGFAAVSGSSIACASTMVNIAVPPMKKYGYDAGFAAGSVAAGGTLGILIPPSIGMVIYALITEMPLGKLLIAGIIPGILTIVIYVFAISVAIRIKPELGPPGEKLSWATPTRPMLKPIGTPANNSAKSTTNPRSRRVIGYLFFLVAVKLFDVAKRNHKITKYGKSYIQNFQHLRIDREISPLYP